MVAAHGEMKPLGLGPIAAFDFSDAPPLDGCGVAVLFITSDDATLATDALRHIEVEAVLLAGQRKACGHQGRFARRDIGRLPEFHEMAAEQRQGCHAYRPASRSFLADCRRRTTSPTTIRAGAAT